MPDSKPSFRLTSTILASSMTWRSMDRRAARRKFSTSRCSLGKALTTIVPVCCDITIWRPPSLPIRALSEASSSFQKSASVVVETWLPSLAMLVAPPLLPAPALDVIDPAMTRVSLRPLRLALV